LASALSLAASCLSSSVISLGSARLSVDSAGDGMTDEGGVVEEREEEDDSLMLTININTPSVVHGLTSTLSESICTRPHPVRPIRRGRHVKQSLPTKMIKNTHPMYVDEGRERTTPTTVT
jgi:hypothetical protein